MSAAVITALGSRTDLLPIFHYRFIAILYTLVCFQIFFFLSHPHQQKFSAALVSYTDLLLYSIS